MIAKTKVADRRCQEPPKPKSDSCHLYVLLDPRDFTAKLLHLSRQVACGRTDLQNLCGSFIFNPSDDLCVIAVWIGLFIDAMIHLYIVFGDVKKFRFV